MKKRILAVLLTLCISLSLAACGGGNNSQTSAPPADNTQNTPAATPAEDAPTTDWPGNDTITVVCPYGAGGDTDFMARLTFEKVQERLGGNFIVQNITGNSGAVGAQTVLDADPDGKTILFYHTAILVNEGTGLTPFGFNDFDVVSIVANKSNGQYFMRADNKYGIKDFNDLREYTAAHPGELTLAYQAGGTSHLGAQMLINGGANCTLVDIGGKSEQLAGLLSGQIDIAGLAINNAREYVDSGEFICLGYAGDKSELYDESKYPCLKDYDVTDDWAMNYSVFAPKGTDPAIIELLSDTIGDICANDADFAARAAEAYYILPAYHNPEDAAKALTEQAEILKDYVGYLVG